MFYGVEQSTDLRCPKTVVKKFTSLTALKKWMENSGGFTYACPEGARNYHRTFRYGYNLNGRINRKDSIFSDKGSRDYPRNENDNIADYLYRHGDRIND